MVDEHEGRREAVPLDIKIEVDEEGRPTRVTQRHERGTVVWNSWIGTNDGIVFSQGIGDDGRVVSNVNEAIEAYGMFVDTDGNVPAPRD
jgi:hypothetical protein